MSPSKGRKRGAHASLCAALLASTALDGLAPASAGDILPTGGSIVSGAVAISGAGPGALSIRQSTQNAIVNWQGFSIGPANRVDIQQPSASSAILNRVTGSAPSTIAGQLNANGQVYLVNPNGIAITRTGVVNAAGFVASTLGVSDADFRAGKLKFKGGGASAPVSNAGAVTIGRGGYAALIGGTIANSGVISAPLGKVGLGSGEAATIDLSGDGFLQVAAPTKAGGKTTLIQNSGTINADGGRVVMSAATAREAARNAVNISGIVQARSISGRSGAIVIGGGDGGGVDISGKVKAAGGRVAVSGRTIAISGRLSASGAQGGSIAVTATSQARLTGRLAAKGAAGRGGSVTVAGPSVELAGASINVSGAEGGGSVAVGARTLLSVDAATTIAANAGNAGDGGAIDIVSQGSAGIHGAFSARGGATGGNGGKVETSGGAIDFSGALVDASAPRGASGLWLIDPTNLTVDAAAAQTINVNLATTDVALKTTAGGASGPGVQTPGPGDIAVISALSWASGHTLTLDAYRAISISAPITIAGAGKLTLIAAADPNVPGLAQLSFDGGSVQFTGARNGGQALSINGRQYALLYSMSDILGVNAAPGGAYALAKPLDATGTTYTQALVGGANAAFAGAFEGLGNTISNLTINAPGADEIGLFGVVAAPATIAHLGLIGGSVKGRENVGALAGSSSGVISQSFATTSVSGSISVGGLTGENFGRIQKSYATGAVSGTGFDAGGLVGRNSGLITQSYATGRVDGVLDVGGLAGDNYGTITQSYAAGRVSGVTNVGGLVGWSEGVAITQSYAIGAVSGGSAVGGLVGKNAAGAVSQTYATGAVSGASAVGGLVGDNGGSVASSYWDKTTTGQSKGVGANAGAFTASGLTTLQFANAKNFAGWTFGTTPGGAGWVIVNADSAGLNTTAGGTRPLLLSEYATNIVNGHQLQLMALDLAARYTLGADIDLGPALANPSDIWFTASNAPTYGYGFVGMGTFAPQFSGTLDGRGHAISNLIIHRPANQNVGLIGYMDAHGVVENINLVGAAVDGSDRVGALVGKNHGLVLNSTASGAVTGKNYVGGLVGWNYGTISNSSAAAAVVGQNNVGGLAGGSNLSVSQSFATGAVTGVLAVGGLIGENVGALTQTYATGPVSGGAGGQTGGLVGHGVSGKITQSHATGTVSGGAGAYVGGLIGKLEAASSIGDSYAAGAVSGGQYVGGLAGWAFGAVSQSHATGAVAGGNYVGGLVGGDASMISDSFAAGKVSGVGFVGGLTGYNSAGGKILRSNATGDVIGSGDYVGGLAGINASGGSIAAASATGLVTGANDVGGLAGWSYGSVADSNATGNVSGGQYVGGLAGGASGVVAGSFATGKVSGSTYVGGLTGYNAAGGATSKSYAAGAVIGSGNYVGGLIGLNASGASIATSAATGKVTGLLYVGGLAGWTYGTVTQSNASGPVNGDKYVGGLVGGDSTSVALSYATGAVSGNVYVGGLAGYVASGAIVQQSFATGKAAITGAGGSFLGGLVGINSGGTISQAYATGAVVGGSGSYIGGLVGGNYSGSITQTYATGATSGSSVVGGLVGLNYGGAVSKSYWDTTATGRTVGVASNQGSSTAAGLTTTQLKSALPAGFDPAVWAIVPGVSYPYLKSVPPTP